MGRLQMKGVVCLVLWVTLLQPALSANRLCYYSAMEFKNKTKLIVHECPPRLHCFVADGRQTPSAISLVSTRGCMPDALCGQVLVQIYKKTNYTMNYSCCNTDYCNSSPYGKALSVPLILTLSAVAMLLGSL